MINLPAKEIIGLTGNSGAGKSVFSREFKRHGFEVIDCDKSAREAVVWRSPALTEISAEISEELINPEGELNRKKTAELIFTNKEKRIKYNSIIYPYIIYNVIGKIRAAEKDYILLDAPTLFEAQLDMICTHIVSVTADYGKCIERIMKRDGISEESAKKRLESQHNAEFFRSVSDYYVINNYSEESLSEKADEIIYDLRFGKA